jgi:hypothetical protein
MLLLGEIMMMHLLLLGSFVCVDGEFDNVYNAKNYLVGS